MLLIERIHKFVFLCQYGTEKQIFDEAIGLDEAIGDMLWSPIVEKITYRSTIASMVELYKRVELCWAIAQQRFPDLPNYDDI